MKYRKIPVIIEAEQWFAFGDHAMVENWKPDESQQYNAAKAEVKRVCKYCGETMPCHGKIKTIDGWQLVCPGDWILHDKSYMKKSHYWAVKADYFKQTYEPIND